MKLTMWTSTTTATIAMISALGSTCIPLILTSGENPMMPAEDIGMETLCCFTDIQTIICGEWYKSLLSAI